AQQEKELEVLKKQASTLESRWQEQKEMIQKIQSLRAKLDAHRIELEQAERDVDLQKAAEIKYGKIPELEKQLSDLHKLWDAIPFEEKVLRVEVDDDDIAKVVARWTGIPVTRMLATESERLLRREEDLKKQVIGQDEAV